VGKPKSKGGQSPLPDDQAKRLAENLKAYIDRHYAGVQRAAERGMGVSQAHISAILNPGGRRGASIATLLRLRAKMRMSLDDLLGLKPFDQPVPPPQVTLPDAKLAMRETLDEWAQKNGAKLRVAVEPEEGAVDDEGDSRKRARRGGGPGRSVR
jgi:hypothetical protein